MSKDDGIRVARYLSPICAIYPVISPFSLLAFLRKRIGGSQSQIAGPVAHRSSETENLQVNGYNVEITGSSKLEPTDLGKKIAVQGDMVEHESHNLF